MSDSPGTPPQPDCETAATIALAGVCEPVFSMRDVMTICLAAACSRRPRTCRCSGRGRAALRQQDKPCDCAHACRSCRCYTMVWGGLAFSEAVK